MSTSSFEMRVLDLAQRSDLDVADLDASGARLRFNVSSVRGKGLTVRITPFEDMWEFSCSSPVGIYQEDQKRLLWPLLVAMLERNAVLSRGCWCLQGSEGDQYPKTLACVYNIQERLLTPEEAKSICHSLAAEVGDFTESILKRQWGTRQERTV